MPGQAPEPRVIDACVVGRRWKPLQDLHVSQVNMRTFVEPMRKRSGFDIKYVEYDAKPSKNPLVIFPGFNMIGGKFVAFTKAILQEAAYSNRKVCIFTGDVEILKLWAPLVCAYGLEHTLCTSFRSPWDLWAPAKVLCLGHDYHANYAFSGLRERSGLSYQTRPRFDVGYVGRPKKERFKVIKDFGYKDLVFLGVDAHKQSDFRSAMCEQRAATPYYLLWEVYSRAAWHICFSDPPMIAARSAPSRMGEAWACGRPCIFHRSMVESRPDVDWNRVGTWVVNDAADVDKAIRPYITKFGWDLDHLKMIAEMQEKAIGGQYFHETPPQAECTMRYFS